MSTVLVVQGSGGAARPYLRCLQGSTLQRRIPHTIHHRQPAVAVCCRHPTAPPLPPAPTGHKFLWSRMSNVAGCSKGFQAPRLVAQFATIIENTVQVLHEHRSKQHTSAHPASAGINSNLWPDHRPCIALSWT